MSCHLTATISGDVTVVCLPLRAGSTNVLVAAEKHDADDRDCRHGRNAVARSPRGAPPLSLLPPSRPPNGDPPAPDGDSDRGRREC